MNYGDHLKARIGTRFALDPLEYPELKGKSYLVADVKDVGNDTFIAALVSGRERWFRDTEAIPAKPPKGKEKNPMEGQPTLVELARRIANEQHISLADATKRAALQQPAMAQSWREAICLDDAPPAAGASTPGDAKPGAAAFAALVRELMSGGLSEDDAIEAAFVHLLRAATPTRTPRTPVHASRSTVSAALSLSSVAARAGESFDALAERVSREQGMSLRDAVVELGRLHPALAKARG